MRRSAPALTEAAIQHGITSFLKRLGFECFHTRFAIGSDPGFPDLVAEFKGPNGRLRPGQLEWIERWRKAKGCLFAEVVGPETTDRWIGYDEALVRLQEILHR